MRRTNCWTVAFVITVLGLLIQAIQSFANNDIGGGIQYIIELIIFVICMFHWQYSRVEVTEAFINITGGPWQWPFFSYIFSSQLAKAEIVNVERHERTWFDIFPYLYCSPTNWCLCHKSYSGYIWPYCCICGQDKTSTHMIRIQLDDSRFRWAPCPFPIAIFWCCKYNVVSVTVDEPQDVLLQIGNAGYKTAATASGPGQQTV